MTRRRLVRKRSSSIEGWRHQTRPRGDCEASGEGGTTGEAWRLSRASPALAQEGLSTPPRPVPVLLVWSQLRSTTAAGACRRRHRHRHRLPRIYRASRSAATSPRTAVPWALAVLLRALRTLALLAQASASTTTTIVPQLLLRINVLLPLPPPPPGLKHSSPTTPPPPPRGARRSSASARRETRSG